MKIAALALAILFSSPGAIQAQESTDDVIQKFINIGVADDFGDIRASCTARPSGWTQAMQALGNDNNVEQYSVGTTTWLARVAMDAATAKDKLMPAPIVDDVRVFAESPAFVVTASPKALNMTGARLLNDIEHVVLRQRGDDDNETVIQPTSIEASDEYDFSNLFGATVSVDGIIAAFDHDAVLALARKGDLTVVLVTPGGSQRRCNLDDTKIKRQFNIW